MSSTENLDIEEHSVPEILINKNDNESKIENTNESFSRSDIELEIKRKIEEKFGNKTEFYTENREAPSNKSEDNIKVEPNSENIAANTSGYNSYANNYYYPNNSFGNANISYCNANVSFGNANTSYGNANVSFGNTSADISHISLYNNTPENANSKRKVDIGNINLYESLDNDDDDSNGKDSNKSENKTEEKKSDKKENKSEEKKSDKIEGKNEEEKESITAETNKDNKEEDKEDKEEKEDEKEKEKEKGENENKGEDYIGLDIFDKDISEMQPEESTSRGMPDFSRLSPYDISITDFGKHSKKYKNTRGNKNSKKSKYSDHSKKYYLRSDSTYSRADMRVFWVDWLRIFSTILIVFVQSSGVSLKPKKFGSSNWKSLLVYNSLSRPCTPLFIMMTSMLLLDPNKELSFKKVLKKYFARVLKCYIFWSVYYNVFNAYVINYNKKKYKWSSKLVKQTIINIIKADNCGHMWYLKYIMVLYLVTPIFRKLTENRNLSWYITSGLVVLGQLFPTTAELTSLPLKFYDIVKQYTEPLENFGGVSAYYLLGHLLDSHEFEKLKNVNYSYLMGASGSGLTVFLRFLSSYQENKDSNLFGDFGNINVGMSACGIFMFFKHALGDWIDKVMNNHNYLNKFMIALSDCSFGIYLVHMTVYHLFSRFNLHTQSLNPIYWTAIYASIIYIVSFGIIFVMRKIPILKDFT